MRYFHIIAWFGCAFLFVFFLCKSLYLELFISLAFLFIFAGLIDVDANSYNIKKLKKKVKVMKKSNQRNS